MYRQRSKTTAMNKNLQECQSALEEGQTIWLLRERDGLISGINYARSEGLYKLELEVGQVPPIADLTGPNDRVTPHKSPEGHDRAFLTFEDLLAFIQTEYQGWTDNIDEVTAYLGYKPSGL